MRGRARARRGAGTELPEQHEINVTPFIDVMLVLLIVFMVAAPLASTDVPVELPASSAAAVPAPDTPLYLTLTANGALLLDHESVTLQQLPARLKAATHDDRTTRIFLRADKSIPYGSVMQTLDALRAAGYSRIGLVALEQPLQ